MKLNHTVRMIIPFLLLNLTSCAILGSKESLVAVDDSAWQTIDTRKGAYYTYKCDGISVSIREIIYNKKTHSFGPLLPIIPSGVEHDFKNKDLTIQTEVVGYVKTKVYKKEDFALSVFENKNELLLTEHKLNFIREKKADTVNTLWGQYANTYTFNKTLKNINSIAINVSLPFQSCIFPQLKLNRKKLSDNEFIIAPGA